MFSNPDTLAALDDSQAAWLDAAIADTVAHSVEISDVDADIVAGPICDSAANLATATAADLDELRAALEPVYTQLRTDADTAAYISAIEALKEPIDVEPLTLPANCPTVTRQHKPQVTHVSPTASIRPRQSRPRLPPKHWLDAGSPTQHPTSADSEQSQAVVFTLDLNSGAFVLTQSIDGRPDTIVAEGGFEIVDDNTYTIAPNGLPPATIEYAFDGTTLTQHLGFDNAQVQQLFASAAAPYIVANTVTIVESAPFTRIEQSPTVPDSGP